MTLPNMTILFTVTDSWYKKLEMGDVFTLLVVNSEIFRLDPVNEIISVSYFTLFLMIRLYLPVQVMC